MFRNDYSEICAKEVLDELANHLSMQTVGYGVDRYSSEASKLILDTFGIKDSEATVHFLAGGTQTNEVVISYFLRPYEAVIACDTGHINVHETGAVEGTGHKVLTVCNQDGKIKPDDIGRIISLHSDEHMVKPRMVYISDSTETGTVYTKKELTEIKRICSENNLILFIDGARLGVALTSENTDVDAAFLGKIADVFYVGGTKNGAIYGEAVVIKNYLGADDFRYHIKNRGAMLAKGFVLGLQFKALFTDNLYFKLAKNSNDTASIIRNGLKSIGIELAGTSNTNQIFFKVDNTLADKLIEMYGLEIWSREESKTTLRAVTSFATKRRDAEEFVKFLNKNI